MTSKQTAQTQGVGEMLVQKPSCISSSLLGNTEVSKNFIKAWKPKIFSGYLELNLKLL